MNFSKIAKTILQNQNSAMGTVSVFAVREALTEEEFIEAKQRGWIEMREEGYYALPMRAQALTELRAAATVEDFQPAEMDLSFEPDNCVAYHRFHEAEGAEPVVGSPVAVVEAGKTFQGAVAGINPDGTYKISFSGDHPARDTFSRGELSVPAPTSTPAPQPAAQQAPSAPPAPGTTVSPMGGAKGPVGPGLSSR